MFRSTPLSRTHPATAPCTIAVLLSLMLGQRLGLAYGIDQVPLTIPVVLLLLLVGLRTGEFRVARSRLPVLAVVWAAAAICTLIQLAIGGVPSIFSLGLVVALYAMVAVSANLSSREVDAVQRLYLRLMTVFALVSVGQMAVQYLGVPYEDYLARVIPEFLLLDFYNTADPIAYGDPLYRSNGIVFLEPSYLSMFLGLAVALALYRSARPLQVTVLLVGMVPPLAGSGFVVLIPAVALMAFSRRRRNLLRAAPAVLVAVVLATLTPLGERYLDRSTEASDPRTSSSMRLVQPYSELLPPAVEATVPATVGHGAGTANDYLESVGMASVTQPLIPKVLFEYGLVGLLGILLPLLGLLLTGVRRHPWTAGLLLLYVYVNASFLQHTQVFLTLFWILLVPALPRREALPMPRTPAEARQDGTSRFPDEPAPTTRGGS